MKFIVTGGAGFIGHNLVNKLELLGHECFVIDSATNYGFINKSELEYLFAERLKKMHASVHYVDLRDHKLIESFFKTFSFNCDGVIHLASFPRQKVVSKNPVWGAEVMGTSLVHLLEMAKQFKIPRFVYISSSMVYGNFNDNVTEDYVCQPQGQYGIMKLMGENLVKDYNRRNCFDYTIIRPSAVYGELDVEDRVVSKFMLGAMRGEVLRVNGQDEALDFTHVSDAASGIAAATVSDRTINKTYNITRSQSKTLHDAAKLTVDIVGKGTIELRDKDADFPSRGSLNIDAARHDFGFDPKVDAKEGFQKYHDWFKSSPFWKTKI